VTEERLSVGKQQVETGGVRVSTHVEERPVEAQVNLREEHVNVQRRAVDRPATEADFNRAATANLEVTETAERAVVSKEARVVEEIEIGKQATERTETIRDTVRKTEVDVERIDSKTNVDSAELRTDATRTARRSANAGRVPTRINSEPNARAAVLITHDRGPAPYIAGRRHASRADPGGAAGRLSPGTCP
jgi:uncharacterized protein (TIGR02271 family)